MLNRPHRLPKAFTLVELLTVIAILSLLLALLMPTLGRARGQARRSHCASNLHQIGVAYTMYLSHFRSVFPYGVPMAAEYTIHPHYDPVEGGPFIWCAQKRGGGTPPQQQFYWMSFHNNIEGWKCPQDPTPNSYNWWDFTVHPNFKGSSYMMSEQSLFGVTWWQRQQGRPRVFVASQILDGSSFGLAADGWMCPNGWHWGTVDPDYELKRIDWTHDGNVNFLWGDFHVEPRPQAGAQILIRSNPVNRDPLKTGGW